MRPEDAHLTLAFLGETPAQRADQAVAAMSRAAEGLQPFEIAFGGVGAFSGWGCPRVLWLGVRRGEEPMMRLAQGLRKELERRGFGFEERPFRTHLTLCRLREAGPAPQGLREAAERWGASPEWDGAAMTVSSMDLLESRLTPSGPVYTLVRRQELTGA